MCTRLAARGWIQHHIHISCQCTCCLHQGTLHVHKICSLCTVSLACVRVCVRSAGEGPTAMWQNLIAQRPHAVIAGDNGTGFSNPIAFAAVRAWSDHMMGALAM
jgi:hypothetical protein